MKIETAWVSLNHPNSDCEDPPLRRVVSHFSFPVMPFESLNRTIQLDLARLFQKLFP